MRSGINCTCWMERCHELQRSILDIADSKRHETMIIAPLPGSCAENLFAFVLRSNSFALFKTRMPAQN